MHTTTGHLLRTQLVLILILVIGMMSADPARSVLAASFTVTNTNDNGVGSLRQTIFDAPSGSTINFDPSLAGQTIALSVQLTIDKDLTIDGSGLSSRVVLSGNNVSRIMRITFLAGNVTISDLTFTKGFSADFGSAIYMNSSAQLTLNNTTFTQNQSSSSGGAIAIRGSGSLTISNSTFYQNQTSGSGGAIYLEGFGPIVAMNSIITENQAGSDGGAISAFAAALTLTDSTLSKNTSGFSGGAIVASQLTLKNTTIDRNQASSDGGAIYIPGNGSGTIANSTIFQNQAGDEGGAMTLQGNTNVVVFNSTLAGNTATNGKEVMLFGTTSLDLHNTIFVCTTGSDHNSCYFESWLAAISTDHSILGIGSLNDYGLAEPADNGGPTQTMALLPGSPLIGAADDTVCANSYVNNFDQRGVTRPQGSHCDIGAYEVEPETNPPTVTSIVRASANPTSAASMKFNVTFSEPVTNVSSDDFALHATGTVSGSTVQNVSGSGSLYTVTVNTGAGYGNLRLDVPVTATINDLVGNALSNLPFAAGEIYSIARNNGADTTGVFRPGNGLLYLKNKNETGFADAALNYGLGGDYPVVGDWDGDGTVTIGVYRNGYFYLKNANTLGFAEAVFPFGQPGDQPIAGDWDGDGVDTIGIFRPSTGQFLLRNSNSEGNAELSFYLGNVGDVGIAGDWDGDGLDTTGVFRPSNGLLYLKNKNEDGFADAALNYGLPGDMPVTGDWDNDGIDTIGVYRQGQFMLRNSNTIGFAEIIFGLGNPGDMPIAGNWDGLP